MALEMDAEHKWRGWSSRRLVFRFNGLRSKTSSFLHLPLQCYWLYSVSVSATAEGIVRRLRVGRRKKRSRRVVCRYPDLEGITKKYLNVAYVCRTVLKLIWSNVSKIVVYNSTWSSLTFPSCFGTYIAYINELAWIYISKGVTELIGLESF